MQHFFAFAVTIVVAGKDLPTVCLVTETGTPLVGTLLMQSLKATLSAQFAKGTVRFSVPDA